MSPLKPLKPYNACPVARTLGTRKPASWQIHMWRIAITNQKEHCCSIPSFNSSLKKQFTYNMRSILFVMYHFWRACRSFSYQMNRNYSTLPSPTRSPAQLTWHLLDAASGRAWVIEADCNFTSGELNTWISTTPNERLWTGLILPFLVAVNLAIWLMFSAGPLTWSWRLWDFRKAHGHLPTSSFTTACTVFASMTLTRRTANAVWLQAFFASQFSMRFLHDHNVGKPNYGSSPLPLCQEPWLPWVVEQPFRFFEDEGPISPNPKHRKRPSKNGGQVTAEKKKAGSSLVTAGRQPTAQSQYINTVVR